MSCIVVNVSGTKERPEGLGQLCVLAACDILKEKKEKTNTHLLQSRGHKKYTITAAMWILVAKPLGGTFKGSWLHAAMSV
jgi:hypothetical protein